MDINFKSAFYLCREAIPFMTKPGSNIVLMGSMSAYSYGDPFNLFT